jgi:hypothetical protein
MADEHDHVATWVARMCRFHAVGWVTDHVRQVLDQDCRLQGRERPRTESTSLLSLLTVLHHFISQSEWSNKHGKHFEDAEPSAPTRLLAATTFSLPVLGTANRS